jgi:hypothetical protein
MKNALNAFAASCRENAEKCKALPMAPQGSIFVVAPLDPLSQLLLNIFELFWRFLTGFTSGLAAGYVSHLALAAVTPRSIPLLSNRF